MGYDYALVHVTYTIPPAVLLSLLYYPLSTRLDLYKILFLIAIAVTSTIPWDSYLIRNNIWSYPPNVVLGYTIHSIPVEEVFFFVIQTFNTTLIYLLLSKPVLKETYLVFESKNKRGSAWRIAKVTGQIVLALGVKSSVDFIRANDERTYLGLILVWALPFLLLLWSLAYQFILGLPWTCTIVPIALPTLYLWIVDTLALKRGTWVIEAGTKTGVELWSGLEIEEAIFFLLTNTLIVFGLIAFDNAIAILNCLPAHFPKVPSWPSPVILVRALLLPAQTYDDDRILGLQQAVARLKSKSRSFYLASSTFQGRLRIDLIILYSFCRVADDLIDNAQSQQEARDWLKKLKIYLDLCYSVATKNAQGHIIEARDVNRGPATLFFMQNFPDDAKLTLFLLPTKLLNKQPLYDLLKGFEMDLTFSDKKSDGPIKSEADLDLYGARVAGTVAELCNQLVLHHNGGKTTEVQANRLMKSGHNMGIALQYTNIARDLGVDARLGRCYVPPAWLKKEKLTAESFINGLVKTGGNAEPTTQDDFFAKKVAAIRNQLLDRAFAFYEDSVSAIEDLPREARAPMRVAVESYMQIGRELRIPGYQVKAGRATVPKWKRIWVAWNALRGPRTNRI